MADLYSTPWGLLGEDAIGEQAQDDFDRNSYPGKFSL